MVVESDFWFRKYGQYQLSDSINSFDYNLSNEILMNLV